MVHRSEKFRAAPASVEKMRALEAVGKVRFMVGNLVDFHAANGAMESVDIRHTDETITRLPLDDALVFFGLSPKLGLIAEWGLALDKNQIPVDTERFEANVPGIHAIGDIAVYPGKKKLILSGFHEACLVSAKLPPS